MESQTKSVVIGLLVAVIAGFGAYTLWPATTDAPTHTDAEKSALENTPAKSENSGETGKPSPQTTKPASSPPPASPSVTRGGTYEVYAPEKLGYAALGEVVLFFHSASCPACVVLDNDIVVNATKIPKDVKILKVDFDASTDLKQKYGLTAPHILIQVNSKGERVTQWSLSSTLSDLVTRVVRY